MIKEDNLIKSKEGSFLPIIIIMIASLILVSLWDKIPKIKNSVHYILDPTAGFLLDWNLNLGMLIIVFVITLISTLVQKYATDQKTLKELKKQQKELQKKMKEHRHDHEKMMEFQKEQFKIMPLQMKLSMRTMVYIGVPFILFFKWFSDYFIAAGNPKLWPGIGWIWFYLIGAVIIGIILKKYMDVV